MTTLIRREPKKRRAGPRLALAGGLAAVLAGGVAALAWHKGGPVPTGEIAITLPATRVGG